MFQNLFQIACHFLDSVENVVEPNMVQVIV